MAEYVPAGFEGAIWRTDSPSRYEQRSHVVGESICPCDTCLRRAEADVRTKRSILFPQRDGTGDLLTALA